MRTGDFSEPRRMSGSAYWVLFAKGLKEYAGFVVFWVVMIAIGSEVERTFKDKVEIVLLLLAGYLALAAVIAFVSWYFKNTGSWRCGAYSSIRWRPSRRR